jgi:hypothetical protein
MLQSVSIQEGPEKSCKGWKRLPPDRIGNPEPVIKDAREVPSNKDEGSKQVDDSHGHRQRQT